MTDDGCVYAPEPAAPSRPSIRLPSSVPTAMPHFFTAPKITVLARPVFSQPEHLPVNWIGDSTDGEKLAEFAGRLCYMSQKNPASRTTHEYLENIKKQGH